jgi:phage terminase large subunit
MSFNFNSYVKEKLKAWRKDPLLFVQDCIEVTPSTQQKDALRRAAFSKRLSIRSGHGTGKDAYASWLILWFMCTRPFAKVICTAPTHRQLKDILWSEISKWLRKSRVSSEFIIQNDKIFQRDAPKEWWIRAVSPSVKASSEEQAETLAGFHGDHMLIVCDEASGIPDPVFIPLEGAMTQEDNRVLLIGNPTKNYGYFHDTQFDGRLSKSWTRLHWDSRESENVTKEMVDYFAHKYGEDSNVFRIRVAGEPPLDDEMSLIPLHWAQQCISLDIGTEFEEDPLYLGVDVARYGDDKSVVLPRRAGLIKPWTQHDGKNTVELAQHVDYVMKEVDAAGAVIDEIGVGAGVVDWLTKYGHAKRIFGVQTSWKSSDPKRFSRLRDEIWWSVREKCMRAQYSFPDGPLGEELCNEIASVRYQYAPSGALKVESKRDMKLRGVSSPNIADALGLTEYVAMFAHRLWESEEKKKKKKRPWDKDKGSDFGRHAWQVV